MTTYEHICNAEGCSKEFELEYGMTEPVPTVCPLCGVDGQVVRLISGGSHRRGVVELTGHDLKSHLKAEGQKLKAEAMRNENVLADIVGHEKLNANTTRFEKDISNLERVKIRSRK